MMRTLLRTTVLAALALVVPSLAAGQQGTPEESALVFAAGDLVSNGALPVGVDRYILAENAEGYTQVAYGTMWDDAPYEGLLASVGGSRALHALKECVKRCETELGGIVGVGASTVEGSDAVVALEIASLVNGRLYVRWYDVRLERVSGKWVVVGHEMTLQT
ncbi:MAG: hypothetical protein ABFS34_09370 [Gemmatimonadota bacterium]